MTALPFVPQASIAKDAIAPANERAASALIAGLVAAGARHAVISPGSRNTPLVLALHRLESEAQVNLHVVLDERSAAFFALGLARAANAPAIFVATSGSAGAHALPAIIEASESGLPLFVITADRPPELQNAGAPQTIDQRRLFGAHARAAIDLAVPDPSLGAKPFAAAAAHAALAALSGKPGPVQINVPFREPLWSENADAAGDVEAAAVLIGKTRLERASVAAIAAELSNKRGVIVAGPIEGTSRQWPHAVAALAARLGWPILAEAGSRLRFGAHDRSAIVTRYDAILRAPELAASFAPERVLMFGRAPCSKSLSRWLGQHASGRALVIADGAAYVDPQHLAARVVAADLEGTIEDLARGVSERRDPGWLMRWREADRRAAAILDKPSPILSESFAASLVARLTPENSAIHAGNGMPVRDLDAFAESHGRAVEVFVSRGANGIDGTLSTAIGEAIARAEPLVLLIGDLAALHDLSGLRLLAETQAPVIVLVLNNGGGGIFDFLPIAKHPSAYERCFLTPQRDSALEIAAAIGIRTERVATGEALEKALISGLERRAPLLIEATIDRAKNVALHQERWAEAAQALDGWRRTWTSAG